VTSRRIDVSGVYGGAAALYVDAYCHLRRAERTFRSDRIIEMASAETGVVFDDPGAAISARMKEHSDPGPDFRAVIGKARKGLAVLAWAARADRLLSADEMAVLLDYVEARDRLTGAGDRDWKRHAATAWIDAFRPTKVQAAGSVSGFTRDGREADLVAVHAARLLAVQKQPEERSGVQNRLTQLGITAPE